MARIFGKKSKYLIFSDIKEMIFAFIFFALLFLIILVYLKSIKIITLPILGVFIIAFIFLYKKVNFHQDRSNQFYRGRRGEDDVLEELKKLPDIYSVFQDVQLPESKANIDFVVVGPTGVFAIEVKSHKGSIEFNGQELVRDNYPFEKNILGQAKAGALKIHDYLLSQTNKDFFVNPALVFSNRFARLRFGFKPVNNVFVIQKDFLLSLIENQSPKIAQDEILLIEPALKKLIISS